MLRSEYMNGQGDKTLLHRQYYAQFVTDNVRALVLHTIGRSRLISSTDAHFNDIPLQRWDAMVRMLPPSVPAALKSCGDWLSLGGGVCVLKEAARQIVENEE